MSFFEALFRCDWETVSGRFDSPSLGADLQTRQEGQDRAYTNIVDRGATRLLQPMVRSPYLIYLKGPIKGLHKLCQLSNFAEISLLEYALNA